MAKLDDYQIKQVLKALKKSVGRPRQRQIDVLLELYESATVISVGELNGELFPDATTPASANASLNRFIREINKSFDESGTKITIEIDPDKKAGDKRNVWFEDAAEPVPVASAPEMDRVKRNETLETGQLAVSLNQRLALITFNDNELTETLKVFNKTRKQFYAQKGEGIFYDLGRYNGQRVFLKHSPQATIDAYESAISAIEELKPHSVIALGIAFGQSEDWQAIGDVLVPNFIVPYEHGKMDKDGFTGRQGQPVVTKTWLDRFRELRTLHKVTRKTKAPEIHIDPILCGDKLVDDNQFKSDLGKLHKEIAGGEMEGYGVYRACHANNVHWCIVKAICDWADGDKENPNRTKDQQTAAKNAAQTLLEAINLRPFPGAGKAIEIESTAEGVPELCEPEFFAKKEDVEQLEKHQRLIKTAVARSTSLRKDSVENSFTSADGEPIIERLFTWANNTNGAEVFAILAEYGMGKTVNCQLFDSQWRDQRKESQPLSLYFDLRRIAGVYRTDDTDIEKLVNICIDRGWVKDLKNKYRFEDLFDWANEYGLILIFDGLDEVLVKLTEIEGQQFTNSLFKLLSDLKYNQKSCGNEENPPPLKMLLSCRTQYFRTLSEQQNHFTGQERGELAPSEIEAMVLLPFTDEQIKHYLGACLPGLNVDNVLETVKTVHDLQDLTRRPFTLKMVAEFFPELEQDIAEGKAISGVSLYRKMAKRWLERDAGKHHIKPEHKLRLAAHLAAYLWQEGSRSLEAEKIENWFHDWLDTQTDIKARYQRLHPDQLEEDLRTATFLAREEDDEGKSGFRFAHTSLQEYFLACYLLQALRDNQKQLWNLPKLSDETLVFLSQLIAEPGNRILLKTYSSWIKNYDERISENLLDFGFSTYKVALLPLSMAGINLTGADLSEYPFYAVAPNLPNNLPEQLEMVDMQNADFSGALLRGCEFHQVKLNGATFDQAIVNQSKFDACDLSDSSWLNSSTRGLVFHQSKIQKQVLRNTDGNYYIIDSLNSPSDQKLASNHQTNLKKKQETLRIPDTGGHHHIVSACALANDGKTCLSASSDRTLRLWDTQSGKPLQTLEGHTDWISACTLANDGKTCLSASGDNTLRLWNTQSGKTLQTFQGHTSSVRACALAMDGKTCLSASGDNTLRLWNTQSGKTLQTFEGHSNFVTDCALANDGNTCLSASADHTLRLWDTKSGETLQTFKGHNNVVNACALAMDGKTCLSASEDITLRLWDTQSGKTLQTFEGHAHWVYACALANDGKTCLSASADRTLRLWETQSGKTLQTFEGHTNSVNACALANDGKTCLSASYDGTLRLWDTKTGKTLQILDGLTNQISTCVLANDGKTCLTASADQTLRLWEISSNKKQTGKTLQTFEGHTSYVNACALESDGKTCLTASYDNTLRLWDTTTGKTLQTLEGHTNFIKACTLAKDGKTCLSASADQTLRLWDTQSGKTLQTFEGHTDWVQDCALANDGKTCLSASADQTLRLWNTETGKTLQTFEGHTDSVNACALANDGKTCLSASYDNTLRLWDISLYQGQSGKTLQTFEGHTGAVTACALANDGKTCLSASYDNTLRLWDTQTGEVLQNFQGHINAVFVCALANDGKTCISEGGDATIRFWDLATGRELKRIYPLHNGDSIIWDSFANEPIYVGPTAWRYLNYMVQYEDGSREAVPVY